MKIENLEKVSVLKQSIETIDCFMDVYNKRKRGLKIETRYFSVNIRQEQEHEVIKALEKIKSNTIEELKELGVEM